MYKRRILSLLIIAGLNINFSSAQTCVMLDSIMTALDGKLFDRYYVCLNENSMRVKDFHVDWLYESLDKYFDKTEVNTILKEIDSPSASINEMKCKGYFADIVTRNKARKIYQKAAAHSESYMLRHKRTTYTVYFFSTPVYIGDYAIVNRIEKAEYDWAYYKILLLKKINAVWQLVESLEGGMTDRGLIQ